MVVAGRPNVGKSTLVNRIVGRRAAVVDREPGVTRDRKALEAEWNGVAFTLIDTGGWLGRGDELATKVSGQSERAIGEADVVLLVADASVGATDEDLETARMVARLDTPVLLVANKVDDANREPAAWELVSLGLGDPWPVSALHGRGTGDLLDAVVGLLGTPAASDEDEERDAEHASGIPRVALVGRPNVGKSTLFNRLVGEERSIVHDQPGTTRDSVDTVIETPEGTFCFVDTAGHAPAGAHRAGDRAPFGAPGARRARRRRPGHPRDRLDGRGDPPGPAVGRADRRGRLSVRRGPEQVGSRGRRGP